MIKQERFVKGMERIRRRLLKGEGRNSSAMIFSPSLGEDTKYVNMLGGL